MGKLMGASLLAKALDQSTSMLDVSPSSSERRPEPARSHRVLFSLSSVQTTHRASARTCGNRYDRRAPCESAWCR
ncbi:hypothetical protein DMX04_13170 [Pseudomonas koreensis]|nr:hypothetical protein DMX04_13170 [Pseudomonas koreensis]